MGSGFKNSGPWTSALPTGQRPFNAFHLSCKDAQAQPSIAARPAFVVPASVIRLKTSTHHGTTRCSAVSVGKAVQFEAYSRSADSTAPVRRKDSEVFAVSCLLSGPLQALRGYSPRGRLPRKRHLFGIVIRGENFWPSRIRERP